MLPGWGGWGRGVEGVNGQGGEERAPLKSYMSL